MTSKVDDYFTLMQQLATRNRAIRTQLAIWTKQIEIRSPELELLCQTPSDFAPQGTTAFLDFAVRMVDTIQQEAFIAKSQGGYTWHRLVMEHLWSGLATLDTSTRRLELVHTAALIQEWICLLDLMEQAQSGKV
jgi:hypothetical protein